MKVLNLILFLIDLKHHFIQKFHMNTFLLRLELKSKQYLFGLTIRRWNLFKFHLSQFDHVQMRSFLEVLFPLTLIERFCLNDIFFVVNLVFIDLFNHSGIEFFRLPKFPTNLKVSILQVKFEDSFVVIYSICPWPFSRFGVIPFLFVLYFGLFDLNFDLNFGFLVNCFSFVLISFDPGLTVLFQGFFQNFIQERIGRIVML